MRPSFPLVLPVTESRRWPEEGKVCTNSPEALDHVRLKLSSTLMSPSSYTYTQHQKHGSPYYSKIINVVMSRAAHPPFVVPPQLHAGQYANVPRPLTRRLGQLDRLLIFTQGPSR